MNATTGVKVQRQWRLAYLWLGRPCSSEGPVARQLVFVSPRANLIFWLLFLSIFSGISLGFVDRAHQNHRLAAHAKRIRCQFLQPLCWNKGQEVLLFVRPVD